MQTLRCINWVGTPGLFLPGKEYMVFHPTVDEMECEPIPGWSSGRFTYSVILRFIGATSGNQFEWVTLSQVANPMLDAVSKPKPHRTCQCGSQYQRGPLHSSWCPDYDPKPKAHVETHEELVARVRAARKGIRP